MKLTDRLSLFLAILFIFEVCILWGGFLFVKRDIDKLNEQDYSLMKVEDSLAEEVVFHHTQGNIHPRDFLLYELVEINRLDSASYLEKEDLDKAKSNLVNCTDNRNHALCETAGSSEKVSFTPLKLKDEIVGYLMLKKSFRNTDAMLLRMFVSVCVLFAFLALNLFSIWLFFKVFFRKDLGILLKLIENGNMTSKDNLKIKEFSQIFSRFQEARKKLYQMEQERTKIVALQEKEKLAAQVAHDIRSPLTALDIATHETGSVPENSRIIIRSCIESIKDIANNLLDSYRHSKDNKSGSTSQLIPQLVESVVSQKRMQYRNHFELDIVFGPDSSSYGLFAFVDPQSFKRTVSNIIDNSIESFKDRVGKVDIVIVPQEGGMVLKIIDNGKGIALDNTSEVFCRGVSIDKPGGAGLGLSYAKDSIESWGGSINIVSQVGEGTEVSINLPRAKPCSWFASKLTLVENSTLVVLDDDENIHRIWRDCFEAHGISKVSLVHFSRVELLEKWATDNRDSIKSSFFLCDFELIGQNKTGIDVIENLKIFTNSYLVTSHFEDNSIIQRCERYGIKVIPKSLAGQIPVDIVPIVSKKERFDVVHVEDDLYIRKFWVHRAELAGLRILSISKPDELFNHLSSIGKHCLFYIDQNLGKGSIDGMNLAKKLFNLGFRSLFLSTGYDEGDLPRTKFLKGIVDKYPPW